jgi:hypothetical protein
MLCALATFFAALAASGTTSAQPSNVVLQTGAFTYTYSFELPSGPKAMTPNLSLMYNSQAGGDGHAGAGWSLGGLGSIVWRPELGAYWLSLNEINDRLVDLDGVMRFRTRVDRQMEIWSPPAIDHQGRPCTFYANTKDGTRYEFGGAPIGGAVVTPNTCDSFKTRGQLQDAGGKPSVWLLTTVVDTFGNRIDFSYVGANSAARNRFPHLDRITWGGG